MILVCATLVGIRNNLWHPSAIPWLANRFPERKGLVMSIHGMGGNVGDAVAPLVVGALLGILSWRSVVVINVVPGVLIAVFALIYLGRRQNGDAVANMAPAAISLRTEPCIAATVACAVVVLTAIDVNHQTNLRRDEIPSVRTNRFLAAKTDFIETMRP